MAQRNLETKMLDNSTLRWSAFLPCRNVLLVAVQRRKWVQRTRMRGRMPTMSTLFVRQQQVDLFPHAVSHSTTRRPPPHFRSAFSAPCHYSPIRRSFAVSRFNLPLSYSIFLFSSSPCHALLSSQSKSILNCFAHSHNTCLPGNRPLHSTPHVLTPPSPRPAKIAALATSGWVSSLWTATRTRTWTRTRRMSGGRRWNEQRRTWRMTYGLPPTCRRDMREGTRGRHSSRLRSTPSPPN
ncbi:hypothetical protein FA13DRAFT_60303 [Coprinellus micaceus]|uniref:Uncharacterized protein n=1 Tax=Coprinellus micaceus TaxID=71717 RepID=A0A4Y7U319_COPMI|nr:hypothetical protein FA13DRAFT_60303 [Coprinellus micaceus]